MKLRLHGMAVLVAGLLVLGPAIAAAQAGGGPEGRWDGAVRLPGAELRVEVTLTAVDGQHRGTVSIPQQNAQDLPLTGVRVASDSVIFTIAGVPGDPTFLGVLAGDSITGTFRQAALNAPFTLLRASAADVTASLAALDTIIEKALADFNVPGMAVGVVHRGEVVYAKGFGYRDVASRLPVTPQTQFAIGSSTKAFTTFALGQLADRGVFDWDTPVREYLPRLRLWDPNATTLLTARDMVTHRTGLPRHDLAWYNRSDLTGADLLERLPYFEPNEPFRQTWQYNNIMYVMAGHLLGTLAGTTWDEAVRRQVFQPLGMTNSNFSVVDMQRAPDHALPYRESGDTLVRMQFRNIDNVGPAGSINSSLEDMLKWAAVHVNMGRHNDTALVRPATLRDMHTPHVVMGGLPAEAELSPASYGLGWMIQTYRGRYRVQHGGNIDGFSALVTLFPRDQLAIVALTNRNATGLPGTVTNHVADRVLDLPHRDWLGEAHTQYVAARAASAAAQERLDEDRRTGTQPAYPLAEYAGTYTHPGYGTLSVRRDGGGLVMTFNGIETPLEHWHYEVFSGLENPADPTFHRAKLQFEGDLRGRVGAVRMSMEGTVPPIRFGREPDAQLSDPAYLQRFAGRYMLEGGGSLLIAVQGDRITMELPGQPLYALVPDRNNEFTLEAASGYVLRFVMDDDGSVAEARLIQPNGVFVARPVR
ncbi:MAG TPA: serine hydrolase [Longimicrobiales bacterium]|nr:serine hydrolase [Longimicrobiales bacterium]